MCSRHDIAEIFLKLALNTNQSMCNIYDFGRIQRPTSGHRQLGQLCILIGVVVNLRGPQEEDVWQLMSVDTGQTHLVHNCCLIYARVQQVSD